jgi:hypothetical protein
MTSVRGFSLGARPATTLRVYAHVTRAAETAAAIFAQAVNAAQAPGQASHGARPFSKPISEEAPALLGRGLFAGSRLSESNR